jgi:hypothetical protein
LFGKDRSRADRRHDPIFAAQRAFDRRHSIGDNFRTGKGQARAQPLPRACRIGPGKAKTGLQPRHWNIAAKLRKRRAARGKDIAKGSFGRGSNIGRPGIGAGQNAALHIADRNPAARAAAINAKEKWFHARAPLFVRLNAVLRGALQIICATGMVRP